MAVEGFSFIKKGLVRMLIELEFSFSSGCSYRKVIARSNSVSLKLILL